HGNFASANSEPTAAGFSTRSTAGATINATPPSASATNASRHMPTTSRSEYGRTYSNSRFNCGENNDATLQTPRTTLLVRYSPLEGCVKLSPCLPANSCGRIKEAIQVSFFNISVYDFRGSAALFQIFFHRFRHHHRPVPTPRAAKSDRQITFAFSRIVRNQIRQQSFDTPQELPRLRKGANIPAHLGIFSGKFTQPRNEVRIRQKSHIKHQVRVGRHPVP